MAIFKRKYIFPNHHFGYSILVFGGVSIVYPPSIAGLLAPNIPWEKLKHQGPQKKKSRVTRRGLSKNLLEFVNFIVQKSIFSQYKFCEQVKKYLKFTFGSFSCLLFLDPRCFVNFFQFVATVTIHQDSGSGRHVFRVLNHLGCIKPC